MDQESVGHAIAVVFEWNDLKYIGKTDANGDVSVLLDVLIRRQQLEPGHTGTAAEFFF